MAKNITNKIIGIALLFAICLVGALSCVDDSEPDSTLAATDLLSEKSTLNSRLDSDYWPPDEPGPYTVGVYETVWVDHDRYEQWGFQDRALPVTIWYPTGFRTENQNDLSQMIGPLPWWGMQVLEAFFLDKTDFILNIRTKAWRDAVMIEGDDPLPVIFFSHGLTAIRFQNYSMCEHLASHGFIVVAPDHYGNAVFTNIRNGHVVIFNPATFVTSYVDRYIDVEFIYDKLNDLNQTPRTMWTGRLDLDKFAVMGHSYGGLTSMLVGPFEDFVKVIAPLNPGWVGPYPDDFSKPFFLLQSAKDSVVGGMNPLVKQAWDGSISDRKIYIDLLNAGHYSATDACLLLPDSYISPATGCDGSMIPFQQANLIVQSYLTAFFKSALCGDDRYDEYLMDNHFPADMDYQVVWPGKD